jgi:hypothetical protein
MIPPSPQLATETLSRILREAKIPFKVREESVDHSIVVVHLEKEKDRRRDLIELVDAVNQISKDHGVNVVIAPSEDEDKPVTVTSVTRFDPLKHAFAVILFVRKPFAS